MRFSYAESMTDPSFYIPLAQAAEAAGYDSMVIPDSICYPEHATSTYPYSPDGTREFLDGKPFLEPFSLIPALGAVTKRLRFVTFVLKLPVRNPVLVAKQATSTAVLTGNRLLLGVGTSPWREDYDILGVPWERRGQRMNEAIDIIRGLAGGGYFSYAGELVDLPAVKISPVPTEPIPILLGGHGEAMLRRAARTGDGWMHGGGDPADLPGLLARLAELRREEGTSDRPFQVHVISLDAFTVDPRLPLAVHDRGGHAAAGGQDRCPEQIRREGHRESAALTGPDDGSERSEGQPDMTSQLTARDLARRSQAAVQAKDRQAWLGLFAPDAVVADPIGPSPLDPAGEGHRGLTAIAAFYDTVIAPNERICFEIERSYLCDDEVADIGIIRTTLPGGRHEVPVRGVYTYRADGAGKLAALRAFWEFDAAEIIEA